MRKNVIGLLAVVCILASCQQDVYDPSYNSNLGAHVPENFDWSTTKTLTVNVDVNDEYDGKYYYAVRVYDKTPGEGILPVAASGKVNKDLPFSQEIVVPATVSKLYIVQAFKKADASEVITKKEVAINGESVACSFGNSSSTTRSASTRGNEEYKNGSIIVASGQTVNITSATNGPKYYVEKGGILNFTESREIFQWTIFIEHGGKMTAADGTTIQMKNSGLYNYGSVSIYDININNGSTLQNGDAMAGENEGGCFTAHNINMVNGHGGEKRYLGERSYLSCEKLTLDNVKLTFRTGAWLNCKVLFTNGGAPTLQGEGETVGKTNYIGLATIDEISGDVNKLTIKEEILVQCSNTSLKQDNIVEDASSMITITGTACSGGFGTEEKNELGTYTYIIEDMYPAEGDYDMNDIVISLTAIQEGSKLTIDGKLKAVGATYKIVPYIKVGDETKPLFSDQGNALEAHLVLGDETGSSIINTDKGYAYRSGENFNLEFDPVNEGLNIDDIDFYIEVNGTTVHWNTYKDGNTWGMRIPGADFRWPQEKVNITKAYPTFTKWFEDKSYAWYNEPNSNLIY